ncbi:MAG: SRPBCC family protein [Candidatus Zixiibacteriota bacterium]
MNPIDTNSAYELARVFPVTPEILYNSIIDSTILKQIWGVQSISVDARPEGKARAVYRIGEQNWDFTITYKEVAPYEKLRWIVNFDNYPTKETRVAILFNRISTGTELRLRMENFESIQERDGNRQAWEAAHAKLADILKSF